MCLPTLRQPTPAANTAALRKFRQVVAYRRRLQRYCCRLTNDGMRNKKQQPASEQLPFHVTCHHRLPRKRKKRQSTFCCYHTRYIVNALEPFGDERTDKEHSMLRARSSIATVVGEVTTDATSFQRLTSTEEQSEFTLEKHTCREGGATTAHWSFIRPRLRPRPDPTLPMRYTDVHTSRVIMVQSNFYLSSSGRRIAGVPQLQSVAVCSCNSSYRAGRR